MSRSIASTLRIWLTMLAATVLLAPAGAQAQSADIDWADAGVASLTPFPTGTTVTGSDGTTATVAWNTQTDGGTFTPAFGGDFVSYFNGSVGGNASPLLFSFNNSAYDPDDRIVITITLSRAVRDLRFTISDLDNGNFTDAIEVSYDNDQFGSFTNAATNTAFWAAGSSVSRTNDGTVNGWTGNNPSDTASANGNLSFDFGTTDVRRIRIVYFSHDNTTGDPGNQFSTLSDLTYFAPGADLSLTKSLIGSPPVQGGTATWRLTVVNASGSTLTADNVVVEDIFPGGFNFGSASGDGSFNSANGQWSVGSLAPGASASITLTGTVTAAAGTTLTNIAEIIASNAPDPDSTPDNGANSEDDFSSSSFTVQSGRAPGVPPVLSCPAGFSVFDWDTISGWTPGSIDNTYAFSTFGDIRFELDNDGVYVTSGAFGGVSPNTSQVFSGGLPSTEASLNLLANQTSRAGEVEITITLPRSFNGLQFTIFDVDFGANQFADRVEVVGSNDGSAVTATLTNGNVNFVSGSAVIGDGGSASNEALGNVVVTFTQPVDTVTVRYGNHTTAPADPGQQAIGLHDITVCNPFAQLSVTKVSSVIADPVNGTNNPKAIPGATVEYLIRVTNTGTDAVDADTVEVWDDGPADAKMCLIARAGGPVIFADPGSDSDLSYSFGGLAVTTDDLEFSNNDATDFNYVPTADGDDCDEAITDFRVRPGGAFAGGADFTLRVRYQVK